MGFADSVKSTVQKILEEVDKKCYSAFWQVSTNIVYLSPSPTNPGEHAKGLLANQWYPLVGGFSSELSSATSPYGGGSLTRINDLANSKAFLGKDNSISLTNNVSYAVQAERVGWLPPEWSGRVGPYRMVALSINKYKAENM